MLSNCFEIFHETIEHNSDKKIQLIGKIMLETEIVQKTNNQQVL